MSRVLIIGIDALDTDLIEKYRNDLPNISALQNSGPRIQLHSVNPPDSHTAWATIHTGLNPAKHGIVDFVDPLDKSNEINTGEFDNTNLRGNAYWDIAGRSGKKVCILLPHVGYPPWEVNGVMVARSSNTDDVQATPQSISKENELSVLAGIKGFPKRGKAAGQYVEKHKRLIRAEADFSLKMLKSDDWDLFFTYSSSLDQTKHVFWNHCDENDPTHPGNTPFLNVIKDLYKLYDQIIGEYLAAVDSDTIVIIQSDHGHGMRPVKLANINEYLRQKGYLVPKAKTISSRGIIYPIEKLKRYLLGFISKHELGGFAQKLMKMFPWARKLYTTPLSIDWQKTIACVTDLSGIKAYRYGGVRILKENLVQESYDEVRERLVRDLSEIRDPDTGDPLMKWVYPRESLYSGKYIINYPDIVFELSGDYGAGWAVYVPFITDSQSHNLVPGSHKGDSAVFIVSNLNSNKKVSRERMVLMDVAPTILDILDIKGDFKFDGSSILE